MIGNRLYVIAVVAASATICSASPAIAPPFDGNWERSGADHPGPLWKYAVRPRNKPGPTLLWQWLLRLRLPGAVGWPRLPLRYVQANGVAGPRTAYPHDASAGFRAAGLGLVAGRPVSAQVSGMPLLYGKRSDDSLAWRGSFQRGSTRRVGTIENLDQSQESESAGSKRGLWMELSREIFLVDR
jgi:hypothetical protein